jgi:LysR substrate binding domain
MNMPDLADLDAFHRRRPRTQRYATVAAPSYLRQHGRPDHPNDLLRHACIRHRFASGLMLPWEYERDGQTIRIAPDGPLVSSMIDIGLRAALDGLGIIASFEEDLASALASGALEPVPPAWWASFSGPFLYYPSRTRCVHSSISSNGPGEGAAARMAVARPPIWFPSWQSLVSTCHGEIPGDCQDRHDGGNENDIGGDICLAAIKLGQHERTCPGRQSGEQDGRVGQQR